MPNIEAFEKYSKQYENWFEKYEPVYKSELLAIQSIASVPNNSVEIGIGSGLFAAELGIKQGIDPSPEMLNKAKERGLNVVPGVAESLPWEDSSFDYALMVTTICFVDNADKSVREVYRILKPHGKFVIAFVDKHSPIGKMYIKNRSSSLFYHNAQFFSSEEILRIMRNAGFEDLKIQQTVFGKLNKFNQVQKPQPGYGRGSFVVIRGNK